MWIRLLLAISALTGCAQVDGEPCLADCTEVDAGALPPAVGEQADPPPAEAPPGNGGPANPGGGNAPPANPPGGDCARGDVRGIACAPDASPIAGARVFAQTTDCAGRPVEVSTRARADGHFLLEGLAPGPVTVHVQAGRFDEEYAVVVAGGQAVAIEEQSGKECLPGDAARVAIVSGEFDSIESIVTNIGFEFDFYCGDADGNYGARRLIGDWATLSQYDVIFFNCGTTIVLEGETGRLMVDNLRRFVDEGGAVYASDRAAFIIETVWPAALQFDVRRLEAVPWDNADCCYCVDCPAHCQGSLDPGANQCIGVMRGLDELWDCGHIERWAGRGRPGRRQGHIDSVDLQAFVGAADHEINYNQGGWVEITGASPDVEVLVSDGEPLMVTFPVGDRGGRVTYTTFHNHRQADQTIARILQGLIFQL